MSIFKKDDFNNDEDFNFTAVKMFGQNAKISYVNYGTQEVLISSPTLKAPFGLSKFTGTDSVKYSLDLSFGDLSYDKNKEFYETIEYLEKIVKNHVKNHSKKFLNKDTITDEVLESLFTSNIKRSNPNYPPNLRLKVPYYNGSFQVSVFDENRLKVDNVDTAIERNTNMKCVVKFAGIYSAGGKFGISFKLEQIKLSKKPEIKKVLNTFAFCEDD